jgi:2Fe-2S ferredoxin
MPTVTYVSADGRATAVEAGDGESVMQAAIANSVDGIVAECGGAMMCATCHVYVDDAWLAKVGARSDDEATMLEMAASEVTPASRLSCQIRMAPALDGLVVRLPDRQS